MMNFPGKKSIGRRQYASDIKDGSQQQSQVTRPRDQKDLNKNDSVSSRSTRSETHKDVSGDGGNVAVTGAFSNFPDIAEKSVETMMKHGYKYLFPIQQHCFNPVFCRDDLIARDLTGSGKTFGFGIPLIEYLRQNNFLGTRRVQAIVLAPTRELALQITNELTKLQYHKDEFRLVTVYGGVPIQEQTMALRRGVDIFVGTTGRILDHIERGNVDFSDLKTVVLDEADVMLKLGFKEDVDKILGKCRQVCPEDLQILLFSATIPNWVKDIARHHMKHDFVMVDLAKNLENKTARNIKHLAVECHANDRLDAMAKLLECYGGAGRIIVFTSTKADANSLLLSDKIKHDIEAMHGDIAQNQREVTLKRFKDNKFQVLVATDVASRGLDIPDVELIIQLEPPKDTESYIHRSGRTARKGKHGTCITFYDRRNEEFLHRIEDLAQIRITRIPIPSEQDMLKAKKKSILKKLVDVDRDVLEEFEETADMLISSCDNDPKTALKIALAYCSGHIKAAKLTYSMLTGAKGYTTLELKLTDGTASFSVSHAEMILSKYWSPHLTSLATQTMCRHQRRASVFFDLKTTDADAFMENYERVRDQRRIDFECKVVEEQVKQDDVENLGSFNQDRFDGSDRRRGDRGPHDHSGNWSTKKGGKDHGQDSRGKYGGGSHSKGSYNHRGADPFGHDGRAPYGRPPRQDPRSSQRHFRDNDPQCFYPKANDFAYQEPYQQPYYRNQAVLYGY